MENKRELIISHIQPILELNGIWFNYIQDEDGYNEHIDLHIYNMNYRLNTNITHWGDIVNSIISFIHYINKDKDDILKIQGLQKL